MSRCLADARADDYQHKERGGLQQPDQASCGRNEARDQQRSEQGHKKVGVTHMEGGPPKMDSLTNPPARKKAPGVSAEPDKSAHVQAKDEHAQPTVQEKNLARSCSDVGTFCI